MKKIKALGIKMKRAVKESKFSSVLMMVMMFFITQVTPAFAAIDGNTIQNNLINNFVKPIYIVVFVVLLVTEFIRKNLARAFIILGIGGLVGIFVFYPNEVEVIIATIKGIFGM